MDLPAFIGLTLMIYGTMRGLFILLAYLLATISVQAQTSLATFLEIAKENSPLIGENANLVSIAKLEQERLKRELTGPRVYLTADYLLAPYFNNRKFIDDNPEPWAIGYDIGITNGGLYSGLVNVNQPLLVSKTLRPYLTAQKIKQQKYAYRSDSVSHSLVRAITNQYIKVYQSQEMIRVNEELLNILKDQEVIVEKLVQAALLKRSDVLLINLEKKSGQVDLNTARSQRHQDLIDLYSLTGIADTMTVMLEEPVVQNQPEKEGGSLFLQQYALDSLSAATDVLVFNTKYRPSLNVFGNAGLNAVVLDNIQRKIGFSAGVGLNIPLYDGHQKYLNSQKAKLSIRSINRYREVKIIEIRNNILKYKRAITALRENIEFLESQETDYTALLEQYKAEIRVGQLSIIDYLKGLRLYRQVHIDLINAKINLYMMKNAYNYWNW